MSSFNIKNHINPQSKGYTNRIVKPKIHVELFRPTIKTEMDKPKLVDDPTNKVNLLEFKRVAVIENKRVKGVQFEQTALFGGFIEVVIAEDPSSEVFNNFLPNDHLEVFYKDANEETNQTIDSDFKGNKLLPKVLPLSSFNTSDDFYDVYDEVPKFSGGTWKGELSNTTTVVDTKINAWDYMRIMQYYNIPRGKGETETVSAAKFYTKPNGKEASKFTSSNIRSSNDFLDYVNHALELFISSKDEQSLFGLDKNSMPIGNEIKFGQTIKAKNSKSFKSLINLNAGGIGDYIDNIILNGKYKGFNKIEKKLLNVKNNDETKIINKVYDFLRTSPQADKYNINIIRFIDAPVVFLKDIVTEEKPDGKGGTTEEITGLELDTAKHIIAEIVEIDQFSLAHLLLNAITIDHGLNMWFTPILDLDENFVDELINLTKNIKEDNGIGRLVYVRFFKGNHRKSVRPFLNFNLDTFSFLDIFYNAFGITLASIKETIRNRSTNNISRPNYLSLVLSSIPFPQPTPGKETPSKNKPFFIFDSTVGFPATVGNNYKTQAKKLSSLIKLIGSKDYDAKKYQEDESALYLQTILQSRTASYVAFMHKLLTTDSRVINFITDIPASYMRADIFTGSKFKMFSINSLAITRIIQILMSSMGGFPATNNPAHATKEGKMDSYPIFLANRVVLDFTTLFGKEIKNNSILSEYELYPSLSMYSNEVTNSFASPINAAMFVRIKVGLHKLVTPENADHFIPLEDVKDFSVIKGSAINHIFQLSFKNHFDNFNAMKDFLKDKEKAVSNFEKKGIILEYREAGQSSVGFSPPEHNALTLTDMTQQADYNAWKNRLVINPNIVGKDEKKPVHRPDLASSFTAELQSRDPSLFVLADFVKERNDTTAKFNLSTGKVTIGGTTYDPSMSVLVGVSQYVDITDIKIEFQALYNIANNDQINYSDTINPGEDLFSNIHLWTPIHFKVSKPRTSKRQAELISYTNKNFEAGETLKNFILRTHKTLSKINQNEMMWMFPYSGYVITEHDNDVEFYTTRWDNVDSDIVFPAGFESNFYYIVYLDLLIKGIRYILWSLAKSRIYGKIYLPIEYYKYNNKKNNTYAVDQADAQVMQLLEPARYNRSLGHIFKPNIIKPGSSLVIYVRDPSKNALAKSVSVKNFTFNLQLFKKNTAIEGYEKSKNKSYPILRLVSNNENEKGRILVWYVAKKVVYIGSDEGAMMRLEMTEGSLDWTLFYNEKNMLTQISEHFLLHGIQNTRVV